MKILARLLILAILANPCTVFAKEQQPETPVTDQDIHKHADRKIDDVNAIGERNVGCDRGLGNWYSLEKQVMMGKTFAQQVETSAVLIKDPVITEYVNRIAQNIVRNSDAKVPFTVKVIDTDEVNAFALPGGYFYVNSGLILAADNESELAGVMAHEIAHVAACHAARQATRGNLVQLAMTPLIFLPMSYPIYMGANYGMGLGVPALFMKFQRGMEAQADYLGLQYMYKAGYDPQSFLNFFEKLKSLEKKKPGTLSKAFQTHPPTDDRIQMSQQEINKILPAREEYKLDTSEFEDVKARLAAIEARKKIFGPKDNQPSLRRAKGTDDKGKSGDDRPTLKKRPEDQ